MFQTQSRFKLSWFLLRNKVRGTHGLQATILETLFHGLAHYKDGHTRVFWCVSLCVLICTLAKMFHRQSFLFVFCLFFFPDKTYCTFPGHTSKDGLAFWLWHMLQEPKLTVANLYWALLIMCFKFLFLYMSLDFPFCNVWSIDNELMQHLVKNFLVFSFGRLCECRGESAAKYYCRVLF